MQAGQILIGCFVECQSIKKVGGRRSVEGFYQALFFVSPFLPECFTETKIEPDRRLGKPGSMNTTPSSRNRKGSFPVMRQVSKTVGSTRTFHCIS